MVSIKGHKIDWLGIKFMANAASSQHATNCKTKSDEPQICKYGDYESVNFILVRPSIAFYG